MIVTALKPTARYGWPLCLGLAPRICAKLIVAFAIFGGLWCGESQPVYRTVDAGTEHVSVSARFTIESSHRELTTSEAWDYATSLFMQKRFSEASLLYRMTAGRLTDPRDQAECLLMASNALSISNSASGNPVRELYIEAGKLANQAQRLLPFNPQIAAFRKARWHEAKDGLEFSAAEMTMKRYDLKDAGMPVMEPLTICIIAGVVTVAGGYLTYKACTGQQITTEDLLLCVGSVVLATVAPQFVIPALAMSAIGRGVASAPISLPMKIGGGGKLQPFNPAGGQYVSPAMGGKP